MNRRFVLKTCAALGLTAAVAACAPEIASNTILDIASSNQDFSTLVAALEAADMTEVLAGEGPLTVFAPTNEAFAALPAGTLATLLMPENKAQLTSILKYHVVPGFATAGDFLGKTGTIGTVQGQTLTFTGSGSGVTVGGANVVAADVLADNGVIHIIDKVLLPK